MTERIAPLLASISLAFAACTSGDGVESKKGPSATDQYERATQNAFEGGLKLQEEKRKAQINIMRIINNFLVRNCAQDQILEELNSLMDAILECDQNRARLLIRTMRTRKATETLAAKIEPLLDMAFEL
ncbi:hypothetical protein HY604_01335 [Candidatus Peregrinibacteria bacterium]|nr:hypothetical protein [Candidatus Peregrinibacteria bacterium]